MQPHSLLFILFNLLLLAPSTHALQFITGPCTADTLCASGCCGFNSGKCEGAIISQERQGCGFSNPTPNNNAAKVLGSTESAAPPAASGPRIPSTGTGNGKEAAALATAAKGTQFITGACTSDNACASGCCGFGSGKCEGAIVSQERQGCGFGNETPNDNAAKALGSTESAKAAAPAPAKATGVAAGGGASRGSSVDGGNREHAAMSCSDGGNRAQGALNCVAVPFVG